MKKTVSEEIMQCCMDRGDLPEFFDINIGKDFHLETRPEYFCEIKQPRTIRIEITSYRGVACGAMHYYARLIADGIYIYSYEKGSGGKVSKVSHGGYVCEEFSKLPRDKKAIWSLCYEIEVMRILTQEEIDADPVRWEYYDAGYPTNAFYTKEEAIARAKEIIKARFDVDWVVKIDDMT